MTGKCIRYKGKNLVVSSTTMEGLDVDDRRLVTYGEDGWIGIFLRERNKDGKRWWRFRGDAFIAGLWRGTVKSETPLTEKDIRAWEAIPHQPTVSSWLNEAKKIEINAHVHE